MSTDPDSRVLRELAPAGLVAAAVAITVAVQLEPRALLGAVALIVGIPLVLAWVYRPRSSLVLLIAYGILNPSLANFVGGADSSIGRVLTLGEHALLLVGLAVATFLSRSVRQRRYPGPFLWAGGLIVVLAIASVVRGGYGFGSYSAIGTWLLLKPWTYIVVVVDLAVRGRVASLGRRAYLAVGAGVAALGLIDLIAPGPFRAFVGGSSVIEYRVGLPSVRSVLEHPGFFSGLMASCFALLVGEAARSRSQRRSLAFAVAALLSFRIKALLDLAGAGLTGLMSRTVSTRRRVRLVLLAMVAVVAFVAVGGASVVNNQVNSYIGADRYSPREVLLKESVEIARDHVPLGVGPGRYGSSPSREPYSPVYRDYGLSDDYGLGREHTNFLTDTSWPVVAGELGIAGLLAYALLLLGVLRLVPRSTPAAARLQVRAVLVVFALDSLGGPGLFDSIMILAVAVAVGQARAIAVERPTKRERVLAT